MIYALYAIPSTVEESGIVFVYDPSTTLGMT